MRRNATRGRSNLTIPAASTNTSVWYAETKRVRRSDGFMVRVDYVNVEAFQQHVHGESEDDPIHFYSRKTFQVSLSVLPQRLLVGPRMLASGKKTNHL